MRTQVQKYTESALGHGGSTEGLEVLVPGTVIDADSPQSVGTLVEQLNISLSQFLLISA